MKKTVKFTQERISAAKNQKRTFAAAKVNWKDAILRTSEVSAKQI